MEIINLQQWKFSLGDHRDPWAPGFDDESWEEVIVPHDWAVSFPFSQENSSGTGYLPGGTGWYRTVFKAGPQEGRRAFINFEGVYKNSQVWCNGSYLGRRPSGYAGFRYDISHCIRPGENNVLAVKVSHEDIADSRWYTGSGIYRRAFVRIHDPVYIKPESLAVTSTAGDAEGTVRIAGEILNSAALKAEGILVQARLRGKDGEEYTARGETAALESGASAPFGLALHIPNPRLWSAETPNLYLLNLELRSGAGGRDFFYPAPPLKIGIRSIRFDPDRGFFINGKNEKLKGVCFHHDCGCLGAAFWSEVWRRRLGKLKAMGCNAVRMSHNPQSPELYDLCDELGFYVMDEAFDEWEGCKNKWVRGHNVYPPAHQGYYEDFPRWHEQDLADMVIRDRNHPSVIMWSIGNEIDYPNDPYVHPLFLEMTGNNDAHKPQKEREYNPQKPNMERLATVAAELTGIVKKYDTSRPVLTAAAFPELSSRIGFFDSLDMVGYNYKEQFYDADHKRFPRLPILGSENGHHLEAWNAVLDRDFISGQFLWTGIDFLGEARGWPVRGSLAGLLDLAGFEKTGYYRRRALWSAEPVLYLVSCPDGGEEEVQPAALFRSWNYGPGAPVRVVCYTNCGEAELFLNGKSLGSRRREGDCLSWTLPFERGKLEARAADRQGREITDVLESTLPAVQFHLKCFDPSLPEPEGRPSSAHRIVQVELELRDQEGRLCVMENPLVQVTLSGEGKILGIENGNLADLSEYRPPRRRVYRGRLMVYVLKPPKEKVLLSAASEGFTPASIEI
ncbi:MAG: DUF4982 domain-containing protein [Treponema sp.]|jgi:hypothetical protein|nr:DUF4982 domain-containing protein [Treponema sp.]